MSNSTQSFIPEAEWATFTPTETTAAAATTEPYREPYTLRELIPFAIFTSAITVTAIVGNILILLAFATTPSVRRLTTYFYASLAVTDLISGLFVMPVMMSFTLASSWKLGKPFCKVWLCIDMFVYAASVYHMCAICLDRFLAIRFPFRYRCVRTKRLILSFIAVAWGLGLIIEVPATIFYDVILGNSTVPYGIECDVEWYRNAAVTSVSFIVTVAIPFLFMVTLSAFIFITIRRRRELSDGNIKNDKRCSSKQDAEDGRGNAGTKNCEADQSPALRKSSSKISGLKDCFRLSKRPQNSNDRGGAANAATAADVCVTFEQKSGENIELKTSIINNVSRPPENDRSAISKNVANGSENDGKIPDEDDKKDQAGDEKSSNRPNPQNDPRDLPGDDGNKQPTKPAAAATNPNKQSSAQRASEIKAATTMGILIGVFLITWLPWKLTTIADAIAKDYVSPDFWYDVAVWLQYTNSMINPFLYVLRENDFKVAIRRILCRVFCCKKVETDHRKASAATYLQR